MSQQEIRMMSQRQVNLRGFTIDENAFVIDKNGKRYKDMNGYDYVIERHCEWCGNIFSPCSITDIFCSEYCEKEDYSNG